MKLVFYFFVTCNLFLCCSNPLFSQSNPELIEFDSVKYFSINDSSVCSILDSAILQKSKCFAYFPENSTFFNVKGSIEYKDFIIEGINSFDSNTINYFIGGFIYKNCVFLIDNESPWGIPKFLTETDSTITFKLKPFIQNWEYTFDMNVTYDSSTKKYIISSISTCKDCLEKKSKCILKKSR